MSKYKLLDPLSEIKKTNSKLLTGGKTNIFQTKMNLKDTAKFLAKDIHNKNTDFLFQYGGKKYIATKRDKSITKIKPLNYKK